MGNGIFVDEKLTKIAENRKVYNVDTLGSNWTYLAIPRQVFICVKLFIGTPCMPQKNCPRENTYSGYVEMHGFHGNP